MDMEALLKATRAYRELQNAQPRIAALEAQIAQIKGSFAAQRKIYDDFIASGPHAQQFLEMQLKLLNEVEPVAAAPVPARAPAQAPAPAPQRAAAPAAPPRAAAPAPQVTSVRAQTPPRAPTPARPAPARPAPAPAAAKPKPKPQPQLADAGDRPRTAAATEAAAAKRRALREANPGLKLKRPISNRLMLFDEAFGIGYRSYAEDQSVQNPYAKGDRSKGWALGAQKAAEDIEGGYITPGIPVTEKPLVPAQERQAYEQELILKSPDSPLTPGNVGSRPSEPAGAFVPAGAPVLETYDLTPATDEEVDAYYAENELEPAPPSDLEGWSEADRDLAFSMERVASGADPSAFLSDTTDPDLKSLPAFLRNSV